MTEQALFTLPVQVGESPEVAGPVPQPVLWDPADEIDYEGDD